LREVTGIGPKRAERIAASWSEQKVIREIMLFPSTAYANSRIRLGRVQFGDSRSIVFRGHRAGSRPATPLDLMMPAKDAARGL
jgi:hypothetical protein